MKLKELKKRTEAQHRSLERDLAIDSAVANRNTYRNLLERFYGWYLPWEASVECSPYKHLGQFFRDRKKVQLLESDLLSLGMAHEGFAELSVARMPKLDSDARLLGSMYVIEGSTLGGQIISRLVVKKLGFSNGEGCRFYQSYGTEVGAKWKDFCDFFEMNVNESEFEDAVGAAIETFEGMQKWLCERD